MDFKENKNKKQSFDGGVKSNINSLKEGNVDYFVELNNISQDENNYVKDNISKSNNVLEGIDEEAFKM